MIFRFVPILEVSTGTDSSTFKLSRDFTSIGGGVIAAGAMAVAGDMEDFLEKSWMREDCVELMLLLRCAEGTD